MSQTDSVTIEFLESHHLFHGVDPHDLALIFPFLETKKFKAGECIIEEAHASEAIYVIAKGVVEATKHKAKGTGEVSLGEMTQGDTFGEMGIIDGNVTAASVHAVKPTSVLMLSKSAFQDIFEVCPNAFRAIMFNIARDLSQRLREAGQKIASLAK